MNSAITFDTLQYANELQKGGFTKKQAETQARAQAKCMNNLIKEQLATKDDLTLLEKKLENRIDKVEHRIDGVEQRLSTVGKSLGRLVVGLPTLLTIGFTVLGVLIKTH